MALLDNTELLAQHIRNVFITHDTTLISEMVLDTHADESLSTRKWTRSISSLRASDRQSAIAQDGSYDMMVASEDGRKTRKVVRAPSTTTQTQVISLDSSKVSDCPSDLFQPLPYNTTPSTKGRTSSFSALMAKTSHVRNPFVQFGKYDGQHKSPNGIRLRVHLTFAVERERTIDVNVISSATVEQAIGLILFQYCIEGREPALCKTETIDDYCLRHHTTDDGDDSDDDLMILTPLTPRDDLKKYYSYHFGHSALQLDLYREKKDERIIVRISFDDKTHTTFHFKNSKVPMREVFIKAVKKRVQYRVTLGVHNEANTAREEEEIARKMEKHVLEKLDKPGVGVNLDAPLEDMGTLEFRLIRFYSKRTSQVEMQAESVQGYSRFESHCYETFDVETRIMKKRIEVQLGISGEKIEIDPLSGISKSLQILPFKVRAESIPCDHLIRCYKLNQAEASERLKLKIEYLNEAQEIKEFVFSTATPAIGSRINRKITFIMNQIQSKIRQDYLLSEKKVSSSSMKLSSFLPSFGTSPR